MKIDTYYYKARLFPAILTSVPLILCYFCFISPYVHNELSDLWYLPIVGDVTVSTAILFLLSQIDRFLSKETFQRIFFHNELYMPTTAYLLFNNDFYEEQIKAKIRAKIQDLFSIQLSNRYEEKEDETNARKRIATAVSQVREFLRDNSLIHRHNIEYGFVRNGLGGCLFAVITSIVAIFFLWIGGYSQEWFMYFLICLIIYTIPLIISKLLIKRFSHYYAKVLYEQFLAKS